MLHHRLRWALLCVAAASGALLAGSAQASRTVVIGPGDSVDSLARRFHVSTRDIARANGITPESVLIDGRKLIIPAPPALVTRSHELHASGVVTGDRVALRRGPGESYRRRTLVDAGTPLVITHCAGDWLQVETERGAAGWIRSDFVKRHAGASAAASHGPARRRVARADDDEPRPRAAARRQEPTRRRRVSVSRKRQRVASARPDRRGGRRERVARARRPSPEASAPTGSSDVVRTAYAYRGVRYRYGGTSRSGFDCSGFTRHVYETKGVNLPHSAAEQFQQGRKVGSGSLKAGDLVFFHTTRSGISHVGIYAGDGKFVHASSGGGRVRVDSLRSGYYANRFRGGRRVR